MNNIQIKDISKYLGQEVSIMCWVYNKRGSGKLNFLEIRDGSGFTQVVAEKDSLTADDWDLTDKIGLESSAKVNGVVKKHPAKEVYEIGLKSIELLGGSHEFPIGKKEHGPDFLFENRDLYLRSKTPWAVLRIRDQVFRSITQFFFEEGFVRFDTPILQPTSCEDTTQLFSLKYYEEAIMYLTQSGQLYLEAGIASLGKAYDFGPVFRAEKSKTRNHLSEFWMMDAEMAFFDQKASEDLQEKLVKRIINDVLTGCSKELELLQRNTEILKKTVESDFIRIKHFDAKKLVEEKYNLKVEYEDDMTTEEEIIIGNHFNIPVFIEDYPMAVKSFYMKSYTDSRNMLRAINADLIAPEEAREIIGGSQREENYAKLKSEVVKRNYSLEDYNWYLDTRKYGTVIHSGFGLGLERMVRWLSGVHHIRETIPFPRTTVLKKP